MLTHEAIRWGEVDICMRKWTRREKHFTEQYLLRILLICSVSASTFLSLFFFFLPFSLLIHQSSFTFVYIWKSTEAYLMTFVCFLKLVRSSDQRNMTSNQIPETKHSDLYLFVSNLFPGVPLLSAMQFKNGSLVTGPFNDWWLQVKSESICSCYSVCHSQPLMT